MGGLGRGDLLLIVATLAAFGAADGAYLTWDWYASEGATWCDLNSYWSCSAVRESPWSHVGPVPTAVVGLLGFLALLAVAVLALRGVEIISRWSTNRWLLALAVVGALVGLGLTLVEILVIRAMCLLCVIGFGLDLGILGLAILLVRAP